MQLSKRGGAALIIFASVCLGGVAATPAYAFTDINGRVCATSDLIVNPVDPNGPSVCPAGSVPSVPNNSTLGRVFDKLLDRVYGPTRYGLDPNYFGPSDYFGSGDQAASMGGRLGMTVTPDASFGNGVAFGAGGYGARSSGVGVTDTAGLLAPGSVSAPSRASAGSGGIAGYYDASNLSARTRSSF